MSNIKVAVRVRPLTKRELELGSHDIVEISGDTINVTNTKVDSQPEYGDSRERVKTFTFDYCYDSSGPPSMPGYASQQLVFQDLGTEVLEAAFDGYNACMFAYGQTSTGKTYTMMGEGEEYGLIPRICEALFSRVDDFIDDNFTFKVDISYLEIYNERVRDLLQAPPVKQSEKYTLKVREHPKDGPYVQDLSRHLIKDNQQIQSLIEKANENRTTSSTHMHQHSSRSHAIVTVTFTQARLEDDLPSEIVSKVHLVDLAGSERASTTQNLNYKDRLKEGANINKSLVTLGNVIKCLAERSMMSMSADNAESWSQGSSDSVMTSSLVTPRRSRSLYVPYRDSVLTWLLKDSLGGNSKTIMISTISPASAYYNETVSTLRYSQRAKSIINKPKINEDSNVTLIKELRKEIEHLRVMLISAQTRKPVPEPCLGVSDLKDNAVSLQESSVFLCEKLEENVAAAKQLTRHWIEKWQETQDILTESDLSIRRPLGKRSSSMGVIVDSQQPHLRGMDDDILNTGIVLYYLKEGKTLIGSDLADREQDIVLTGQDIQPEHCFIQFVDGTVILYPRHNAPCAINGVEVTQPTKLTQGDTVRFGDSLQFRFNNPAEAAKLREFIKNKSSSDSLVMEKDVQTDPKSGSAIDAIPDVPLINKSLPVEQDQSEKIRIKDARVQLQRVKDKLEKAVNTYNKAVQQMQQIQTVQKGKQDELMQYLNDLVANCNQMHMQVTKELSKMKNKQDKGTDTQAKSTSTDEKGSPDKDSESPKSSPNCREEPLKAAIDVNPQLQELQKTWHASEAEVAEYEQKMRLLKEEHNKAMMLKSQEVSSQLERINILKKQKEKLEQLIEEVGHLKRVSKDKLALMHGANTDESVHYDVHLVSLLQDSVNKRDCLRQANETSLPQGQKFTEEELMSKPVGYHNSSSCSKSPQSKSVTSNLKCKKSESSQLNKDKSTARAINRPHNQTQTVSSPSRNGKMLPENIQFNESEKNIAEDHLSDYSDDSLDKTIDEVNPVTQTSKTADSTSHAGSQVSHPNSVQKCDKDFDDVKNGQTQPMQYVKEESTQVIFKVGTKVLAEPSSMNKSESVSPKLTSDACNSKVSPGGGRVGGKNSVDDSGSNTQATLDGQCCSDQPSNQNSTECRHTLAHPTAQASVECHHSPAQSSNLISQIPKKILQLGDIRKVCTSKIPTKRDAIEMDNLKPGSINKVAIKPDIKVDSLKPVSGQYCGQSVEETCPVVEMEMASSPDKPEAKSPSGRNTQETLFQLDDIYGENISLGLKDSPEFPSHQLINPVVEGSCLNPANFAQNSISSEIKGAKQPSNVKSGCCQNDLDKQDCLENVPKSDSEETVEIKLGNKAVFCKISDKKSVRPEGKAQNQSEEVFENSCMSNRLSEFVLSEMKKRQSSKVDSVKSQSPPCKSQQSQTKSSNIPHIVSSERTENVKKDFDKNLTGSKESMVSGKSEQTDFDLIATKNAEPLHGRDCSEMRLRTKSENLPSKVALNSRLVNAPSDQSLVTPEESCLASNSCHLEGNLGENQVDTCLPVRIAPENKDVEAKCKPVPNTKCQKKPIGQCLSSSSLSSPSMTHPLQESNDSPLVRNSKPIISTHSHEERSSYLDQDPGSNVSLPNKTTKLSHCSARTELVTEFSDDNAGKACPLTYIVKVSEEETDVFYNVESTDYKISKIRKTLPATKGFDQIDSLITTESFCADSAGLAKEKPSGAAFNHSSSNSNIPRSETNSKSSSKLAKDSLLHSLDVGKTELEDNPRYSIDRKESLISGSSFCIRASHDHSNETCLLKSKGTLASDSRSILHDGCRQCLQTGTDLQETVVLNGKVKDSTNTIDDSHQKTPTDHNHLTCNSSVVGSPSSRSSNGEWVTCNLGLYGLRRETKLKNMTKCMSDSAISSDLTDVDSGTLSPQPSNIPSWLCSHHPHHHYNHHNHRNFNRLFHLDLPEVNKSTSCANNNPMTPSKPLDLFPWCKSPSSFVGSLLKVRPYSIGRSISVDGLNVWLSKVTTSDLQPTCKNHSNDEMISKYPEPGRLNPSKTLANTPIQSAELCNPHQDSAAEIHPEFETVDPALTEMKQDSYSSSASSSPTSASLYMGQYHTGGSMVNLSQEEFEKLERDLPSDISSLHSGFSGRHGNDNWHHSDVINEPDLIGINDDNDGYLYFKSDDEVRVENFQPKFLSRPTKMAGQKSSRIKFVDAKEQNLQRRYKYHAPNSGWSSTDDSADTTFRYMKATVVKSKNIKGVVGHNSSFINDDDDDDDESVFEDNISQYHHSGKRNRFPVLPHSKSASTTDLPADYPTSPSSYRSVSPSLSSEIAIEDERSMKYKPKLISVGIQTSQNECATQTENQPSLAPDFTIPLHDQILKDSQASNRMPFPIHIPLLIPESGTLHSLPALMLETTNLLKNLTKHLTVDPSLPSPASESSATSFNNNNLKCNTSTQTECKPNVPSAEMFISAPDNSYPQSYLSDKENHSREYFPNMTQAQQNIVNQEQRAYTNGNYSQPSELHINRSANPNSYSSLHQQKKRLYLPLKPDTSTLGSNSSTLDAFKGDMCDSFTYHPQGHPNYREDCQAPAQHYHSYRYQSNSPSEPNAARQHHRSPNDLNPNLVGSAQHFHSTPYKNDVDFSRQFKFNQSSPLPNGNFDRSYHSMKYTTPSANKRPWQDIINYSEYNLDSTVHDIHVNPNWPHSNFRNPSPGAHVPCQDFSGHSYGNNYMNPDVASQQGAGPRHRFRSMTIASNDMSRVRLPLNRHNTLPRSSLSHSPNQPFFQENTAWEPQQPPFQQYATLPRGYKFGSSNLLDYNNDPRHAFDYPDNQNMEDYYNEELSLSLKRSGVTDEYLELLTKSVKSSPTEQPSSSNSITDRPKYRTLSNLTSPSDRPQQNRFNKSLTLPTYKSSQSKSPNTQFTCEGLETKSFSDVANDIGARVEYYGTEKSNDGSSMVDCSQNNDIDTVMKLNQQYSKMISKEKSSAKSQPKHLSQRQKENQSQKQALEKKFKKWEEEQLDIMDMVNLKYLPVSFTVKYLEKKVNHCIAQTDMLLDTLDEDEGTTPTETDDPNSSVAEDQTNEDSSSIVSGFSSSMDQPHLLCHQDQETVSSDRQNESLNNSSELSPNTWLQLQSSIPNLLTDDYATSNESENHTQVDSCDDVIHTDSENDIDTRTYTRYSQSSLTNLSLSGSDQTLPESQYHSVDESHLQGVVTMSAEVFKGHQANMNELSMIHNGLSETEEGKGNGFCQTEGNRRLPRYFNKQVNDCNKQSNSCSSLNNTDALSNMSLRLRHEESLRRNRTALIPTNYQGMTPMPLIYRQRSSSTDH